MRLASGMASNQSHSGEKQKSAQIEPISIAAALRGRVIWMQFVRFTYQHRCPSHQFGGQIDLARCVATPAAYFINVT